MENVEAIVESVDNGLHLLKEKNSLNSAISNRQIVEESQNKAASQINPDTSAQLQTSLSPSEHEDTIPAIGFSQVPLIDSIEQFHESLTVDQLNLLSDRVDDVLYSKFEEAIVQANIPEDQIDDFIEKLGPNKLKLLRDAQEQAVLTQMMLEAKRDGSLTFIQEPGHKSK